ncbi:MAG: hypothetical protein ACOWYE_16575 [Desulfatiglandales bacterium]
MAIWTGSSLHSIDLTGNTPLRPNRTTLGEKSYDCQIYQPHWASGNRFAVWGNGNLGMKNVDFRLKVIKMIDTLVPMKNVAPKHPGSIRNVDMLPPVYDALRAQRKSTWRKSGDVFLNK